MSDYEIFHSSWAAETGDGERLPEGLEPGWYYRYYEPGFLPSRPIGPFAEYLDARSAVLGEIATW